MIRNLFVVLMSIAGAVFAATILIAIGWWNVRGEQAPVTALGIVLVLLSAAIGAGLFACRLLSKTRRNAARSVITAAGPTS